MQITLPIGENHCHLLALCWLVYPVDKRNGSGSLSWSSLPYDSYGNYIVKDWIAVEISAMAIPYSRIRFRCFPSVFVDSHSLIL